MFRIGAEWRLGVLYLIEMLAYLVSYDPLYKYRVGKWEWNVSEEDALVASTSYFLLISSHTAEIESVRGIMSE